MKPNIKQREKLKPEQVAEIKALIDANRAYEASKLLHRYEGPEDKENNNYGENTAHFDYLSSLIYYKQNRLYSSYMYMERAYKKDPHDPQISKGYQQLSEQRARNPQSFEVAEDTASEKAANFCADCCEYSCC